jgi:hypothetical protein
MILSNIHLYQVVVVGISAIMIYQGVKGFVRRESGKTILKLFVRIVVWVGMALVALFPSFTEILARIIGLEGNINAVILTGFLLVFVIIFKLISIIEKMEQNISKLTRNEAIKDFKDQNDRQNGST